MSKSLLAALALAACHSATPVAPDAPATPSVTGHWTSACFAQMQADGSTAYATIDLVGAQPAAWSLVYTVHGDAACTQRLVAIGIHGSYEVDDRSTTVPGAWNARFGFDDKTITPYIQPIADALTSAGCGGAAWQLGVAQSVYAAGCAAFGQYPAAQCPADYDLLDVSGSTLHFGNRPADNNMCTPDHRPTQISTVGLARQAS